MTEELLGRFKKAIEIARGERVIVKEAMRIARKMERGTATDEEVERWTKFMKQRKSD